MSMGTDSVDHNRSRAPTNMVVHRKVPCYTIISNSQ